MEKPKLLFATGNAHKMIEIREILGTGKYDILSMKEAGLALDIVEDGDSFEANALIKARAVQQATGHAAMADDSGLEVDYLNGAPGIYSARFLGEDTSYTVKNQYLIDQLADARPEERTARFVCAIALVTADGAEYVVCETMEGEIAYRPAGENGFGYDPIFYLPEFQKTSAELSPQEKNALSHRGKALRRMREIMEEKKLLCDDTTVEEGVCV